MNIIRKLEVEHSDGTTYSQMFLTNEDLLPVPHAKQTWKHRNFIAFWMIASSMIQAGLSWWQAWICVWIGYGIVAPFIVLNARPGAIFHITFPVVARTSFGLYGSLWCTFNRGAMACVWYGVQASIGGSCMFVMLRAMWPSIDNIPNGLPDSAGITTKEMLAFFLFWLISLPAIWFPLHQIRHLFTVKAIITPIAGLVFFVWCIVKAKGVGPIIRQPGTMHGSDLGWGMVTNLMSCISNMATLLTNAPDFASRSHSPSAALWPQLLSIPFSFAIVNLLNMFLDNSPSHATRFGVWFIAFAFIIAQVRVLSETNISANSVSAGCDLTSLFPRFINIRRGGYIAAIVGYCILPWKLLASSNGFTSYLSAYSVFLSSIAGVMVTEYYFIRKGHYRVTDLYDTRRNGWYWYTYGFNYRAYVAYIAGILINVVGFAGATGRTVPIAATRIYEMSFFTGFGISTIVYLLLNWAFPVLGASETFEEVDVSGWDSQHLRHDSEDNYVLAQWNKNNITLENRGLRQLRYRLQ
ncbi:permease for cytosine/purines, uracil, thiamine, allantoin-domain-containing protein [Lentinula edodes]|uniref:permease for cytosine/purines, uracil, thiamine, allantoin-domain-containing protein n=1 Tax=Lentinula edodes TaxID=5353 RepID=UPI001E8D4882|nr:permease for cytosine/purines, uracil, thiamine, allantoin-domain-containing protein [Lentinula edodes]KAH7878426.1 permease for cytosine/purines, uracil, thiamine, allantoin-domain-containing protein [Lentinula edodes]